MQRYQHPIKRIIIFSPAAGFTLWQQDSGTKLVTKKSIAAKEIILKHNKTFGGSLNDLETITQAGITRKTFYKYKKELLSEMIEQTDQR